MARQVDGRYTTVEDSHVRWFPQWYVEDYIVPRHQAGKAVAGECSFITQKTEGHVVLLPFFVGEISFKGKAPYHIVVVDMVASRVLGVYKITVHTGPVY